jgi:TfoX N-terminal domain
MSAAEGDSEARYAALAEELATSSGVTPSKMFGMPTLKADGKAFAGLYEGSMVFKLDGEAHRRALALPGAHIFDPSGMGRPMKAWVVVPGEHGEAWTGLAREALASLRGG